MAYIVMAYVVMAYVGMACIVMAIIIKVIIVVVVIIIVVVVVVVVVVIVVVILSGLDALGHKVVPVTGDSGALGGVVKSAEHRLVELAGRLQVQSGLGLVVGPLRSGKEMGCSCFVLCRKKCVR